MDQYRTQPFEPEPEQAYDEWDYQDPRPKILWGRVAVLGGALLIAFFLGRALAPDGIQPSTLAASRQNVTELEQEVERLNTELRQTQRELTRLQNSPPPAEAQPSPEPTEEPVVYTVEPGDTLLGLAEEFYGDPSLSVLIAQENGLRPTAKLNVGDSLIIPPKP